MAVTAVASDTTSTLIIAARASRKGLAFENSDANRVHVLMEDGTASTANKSFSLAQNENAGPFHGYTGAVFAIWEGDGSGSLHITEW